MRFVKNTVPISGSIEIYCEPSTLGYFLNNYFGAATETVIEAGIINLHEFKLTGTEPPTYTYEFQVAGAAYVERFFGCRISKLSFAQVDNVIKLTMDIVGQKAFSNAKVTKEATSGTELLVDQTSGLTTSDSIKVLNASTFTEIAEYTIAAIVSETELTVSTISDTLPVDALVVIASQSPTYSLSSDLIYKGGSCYKIGVDIDNTSSRAIEDFTFEFNRESESFFAACGYDVVSRMASAIKLKSVDAIGSMKKYYDTQEYLDKLRQKEDFAARLKILGAATGTNAAAVAATRVYDNGTGTDGFNVTASTAGEDGNDINVILEINTIDTLAAAISGNTVTVSLANTTSSNNTGTLIAAAIDALTGVDSAAEGAGTDEFTVAATKINLAGGRDAYQKEMLQIDFYKCNYDPFNVAIGEDEIVSQDMNMMTAYDTPNAGNFGVSLRSAITSY